MPGTLWFYIKDDKRLGPVDFEQLVGLLMGGQLPQGALVWHQGLREWSPADRIPEIAEQLPPPLPPPGKAPRSPTLIIEAATAARLRAALAPEPAPAAAPAVKSPRIEELRRRLEKDPASRVFATASPQGAPPTLTREILPDAASMIDTSFDGPLAVNRVLPSRLTPMPQGRPPTPSISRTTFRATMSMTATASPRPHDT